MNQKRFARYQREVARRQHEKRKHTTITASSTPQEVFEAARDLAASQPPKRRRTPSPPGEFVGKWDMRHDDGLNHPVETHHVETSLPPASSLSPAAQRARAKQIMRMGGKGGD